MFLLKTVSSFIFFFADGREISHGSTVIDLACLIGKLCHTPQ